jgi:hypothetical protein
MSVVFFCPNAEWDENSVVMAMMAMIRMTTEPKNVIPLAELSILELVFALTIPSPSILEGLTGMWQLLPGLEHPVGPQPEAVCDKYSNDLWPKIQQILG